MAGCGGRPPAAQADLWVGNSGTTVRFLTALATLGQGTFRLDGTERMRSGPSRTCLDALGQLGADVASQAGTGCPPVTVRASGLPGGHATVAGNISSQFLSGLLMAAPCANRPVQLTVRGELVSKPYIAMTLRVMADFGIAVQAAGGARFDVPAGKPYRACRYRDRARRLGGELFLRGRRDYPRPGDGRGPVSWQHPGRRGLLRLPGADGLPCGVWRRPDHGPRRPAAGDRGGHERHQRHRANPGRRRPVCRGTDDDHPHRPHSAQRNRSNPRTGHRTAESGRCGGRARRRTADCAWHAARGRNRHLRRPSHGDELWHWSDLPCRAS